MPQKDLVTAFGGIKVQGFATRRIAAVVATEQWTPAAGDLGFCVPEDCTYKIGAVADAGTLLAGKLYEGGMRIIPPGQIYIFDTSMNIEVM